MTTETIPIRKALSIIVHHENIAGWHSLLCSILLRLVCHLESISFGFQMHRTMNSRGVRAKSIFRLWGGCCIVCVSNHVGISR